MYTRCPTCSTCFRVTDRHLAIAKGKVRCGRCQFVFNATEHAIDDLPANPTATKPVAAVTPVAKSVAAQPENLIPEKKTRGASPDTGKTAQAAEIKNNIEAHPGTTSPAIKETEEKVTVTEAPKFKADTTMIADFDTLNKDKISEVNLDAPSGIQNNIVEDDDEDDIFDDNFDLNAAIDELTSATAEKNNQEIKTKEEVTSEQHISDESRPDGVFDTDAYDATNASSVADIMNEMEGQLSLNIPEPGEEEKYNIDDEFDFIELDSEAENSNKNNETKEQTKSQAEEKFIDDELEDLFTDNEDFADSIDDEFSFVEAEDVTENEQVAANKKNEESFDEDKLFDQIDLSDLQDHDDNQAVVLNDVKQNSNEEPVPFQLKDNLNHLQSPTQRRFHPLISFTFILILLAASFSQLAYFRSHELVKFVPATRPLLEKICDTITCHYSGPRETKQIQLISRDVRLHPKEKKALLISAAMINNAHFAQPYPNIHIRLSDISGNVVAERIFDSKTYMGKLSNPFLLMKSKTPVHINFEVVDPGKDAVNFEFTFL